eukprot:COSAG04_NODE_21057_length_381_cov_0.468085_1_plen_36_part_10
MQPELGQDVRLVEQPVPNRFFKQKTAYEIMSGDWSS